LRKYTYTSVHLHDATLGEFMQEVVDLAAELGVHPDFSESANHHSCAAAVRLGDEAMIFLHRPLAS